MKNTVDQIYNFVFRGMLTDQALDNVGRQRRKLSEFQDAEIAKYLSIELLDASEIDAARKMATVYVAIAAFENSARRLIEQVLLEDVGENWWETCVSTDRRRKAESRRDEESKTKWHASRGDGLIYYTEMADLANIIRNNFPHFEPYVRSIEWAESIFRAIEKSRNVIMHSGTLEMEDIQRIGINIRDWIKQVGT